MIPILYNDPVYIHFAPEILDGRAKGDLGAALICADWLEEKRAKDPASLELAGHLRRGLPVLTAVKEDPLKRPDLNSYDWREAFGYAGQPDTNGQAKVTAAPPGNPVSVHSFAIWDVKEVVTFAEGENDGPEWMIVGKLWDSRWFTLRAGCDYTGWD